MSEPRSTGQRKSDVLAGLAQNRDMWLATSSPSGRPHMIPVSSWWDGSQVVIATIGGNRTARNLDATGLGRLALGSPDDVVMIDVSVSDSVPVHNADPQLAAGFATAAGWNPVQEAGNWRFFRLTPLEIQAYRGYGELQGRQVMHGSQWLD